MNDLRVGTTEVSVWLKAPTLSDILLKIDPNAGGQTLVYRTDGDKKIISSLFYGAPIMPDAGIETDVEVVGNVTRVRNEIYCHMTR